ncbi:unnamed protein product [Protopolystoma xenopodis]|uniref:Uncharacterized protein n=1 Tax=Protopolystoma xenopodis TaxID=117903 RepID=A0A3S5AIU9_9PLAT|nr:unnamed protein product [Protopolystoma xenopodis]
MPYLGWSEAVRGGPVEDDKFIAEFFRGQVKSKTKNVICDKRDSMASGYEAKATSLSWPPGQGTPKDKRNNLKLRPDVTISHRVRISINLP